MVVVVKNSDKFEPIIWVGAIALVAAAIGSYHYFSAYSLFLRVLTMIVSVSLAGVLITKTSMGRSFIKLWRESLFELRKVIWPTKKETYNFILAVGVMVFIMGLVLGLMDWMLSKGLHWLLSVVGV
jgi:preprotein translocase subunit SecE